MLKYVEKHCIRIIRNSKNEDYLWILDFLKRDLIRLLVLMFELIKLDFQYDYRYKSFLFSCVDGAGNAKPVFRLKYIYSNRFHYKSSN